MRSAILRTGVLLGAITVSGCGGSDSSKPAQPNPNPNQQAYNQPRYNQPGYNQPNNGNQPGYVPSTYNPNLPNPNPPSIGTNGPNTIPWPPVVSGGGTTPTPTWSGPNWNDRPDWNPYPENPRRWRYRHRRYEPRDYRNVEATESYEFSSGSCTTGKHRFYGRSRAAALDALCDALRDEAFNHYCEPGERERYYREKCGY